MELDIHDSIVSIPRAEFKKRAVKRKWTKTSQTNRFWQARELNSQPHYVPTDSYASKKGIQTTAFISDATFLLWFDKGNVNKSCISNNSQTKVWRLGSSFVEVNVKDFFPFSSNDQ